MAYHLEGSELLKDGSMSYGLILEKLWNWFHNFRSQDEFLANFQMWPRISENQKKDGKGQASVGLLLPAGGPRQGLTRGPQARVGWVGLLAGPPTGGKGVEGPALGLLVLLTAQEERRPKT